VLRAALPAAHAEDKIAIRMPLGAAALHFALTLGPSHIFTTLAPAAVWRVAHVLKVPCPHSWGHLFPRAHL
jgi:hypothetical protein